MSSVAIPISKSEIYKDHKICLRRGARGAAAASGALTNSGSEWCPDQVIAIAVAIAIVEDRQ